MEHNLLQLLYRDVCMCVCVCVCEYKCIVCVGRCEDFKKMKLVHPFNV